MITPLFHVDPASSRIQSGDSLVVAGEEGRHAVAVRRIRVGERVHLTDGLGRLITGVVESVEGKGAMHVRAMDVDDVAPSAPSITVAQAIIKGDRGEAAIEMLTEAGVDAITPWAASRCIAKWAAGDSGVQKWRRTAREASKQSRRPWFPVIDDVRSTAELMKMMSPQQQTLVLHESAAASIADVDISLAPVMLVIGPEGGITDEEIDGFLGVGATPVRIGPTVLRASTAGVAAIGVLMTRLGRW